MPGETTLSILSITLRKGARPAKQLPSARICSRGLSSIQAGFGNPTGVCVALLAACWVSQPAGAAYPGSSGQIAFSSDRDGKPAVCIYCRPLRTRQRPTPRRCSNGCRYPTPRCTNWTSPARPSRCSVVLRADTTHYATPPWLRAHAGEPLRWRVRALNTQGRERAASALQPRKISP